MNPQSFAIIALAAVWLVCLLCKNLALRVWGFIVIILGFIFVLGGGFRADGLLLLGMTLPVAVVPAWAVGTGCFAIWL